MAPPMHLDLYFMLAAAHDPELYAEGLKQISASMMFFQANPLLTPQNLPDLPPQISLLRYSASMLSMLRVSSSVGLSLPTSSASACRISDWRRAIFTLSSILISSCCRVGLCRQIGNGFAPGLTLGGDDRRGMPALDPGFFRVTG